MGCGGSKNHQAVQAKGNNRHEVDSKEIRAAVKAHGGPRDALCHICGRKYTIHSIDIHVPQCEKLWIQRQELLPTRDRKPVPTLPGDPQKMTLEKRNELALKLHTQDALECCQYCSRNFVPDRLKAHIKSCERNHNKRSSHANTKAPKIKPPSPKTGTKTETRTAPSNNYRASRDTLQACEHCGRTFYSDSLQVHLRSCAKNQA